MRTASFPSQKIRLSKTGRYSVLVRIVDWSCAVTAVDGITWNAAVAHMAKFFLEELWVEKIIRPYKPETYE